MHVLIVFALAFAIGQQPAGPAPERAAEPAPIYTPGMKLYVNASGLAFRRGPSLDTERIHYITQGQEVTVLVDNRVPVSFEAEGIKGHWLYVQHGAYKGYVFDGFLSRDPQPLDLRIDWTFVPGARVGPITAETGYEELVEIFGAEHVTDSPVDLGEGETEPGTAVHVGIPNAFLVIQWAVYREQPKAVHIRGENSPWKSLDEIGIGTPLATLEQLNGKPVSFAGFGWDYAGTVTNWNGGALERSYELKTHFRCTLAPTEPYSREDHQALLGDSVFTSDLAAVTRLNLRVATMIVRLGRAPKQTSTTQVSSTHALRTYTPGAQYYVLASKLNMRARPELGADLVASIPYGAQVTIAAEAGPGVPLTSEGMPGQWVAVDFSGRSGYVFDAYLSPLPAPRQGCSGLQDYVQTSSAPIQLETGPQGDESVTISGISVAQAFVLAIRAVPAFAGAVFALDSAGGVTIQSGSTSLSIRKAANDSVRLTVAHAQGTFAP
jgi:hypothetical protein